MNRKNIYLIGLVVLSILIILHLWLTRKKYANGGGKVFQPEGNAFQPEVKSALQGYFNRLFPIRKWEETDPSKLKSLYISLDAWYTPLIWAFNNYILDQQPNWREDRLTIWTDPPGPWQKLFDGSVCDCMRFAYPTCVHPKSRFSGADVISDCPDWPGLHVGCTYDTILRRAYNTNNNSGNFITDSLTQNNKGFPDYSWFEGLAYPGEYGHPEVCGKLSDELQGFQPGVQWKPLDGNGDWQEVKQKWSDGPWFNSACKSGDSCPVDFLKCVNVKGDGQYPEGNAFSGKFCINNENLVGYTEGFKDDYTEDDYIQSNLYSISPRSYNNFSGVKSTSTADDCTDFPKSPCKSPSKEQTDFFHGLWLYPLRGIGMWRNMGKSVVSNTKFGLMINQAGYDFNTILYMAGGGGGDSNIITQYKRLVSIIQYGSAKEVKGKYPAMNVSDLKLHGGKGYKLSNAQDAQDEAKRLMTIWYTEGYSGLGMGDHPNGFNYNYTKYFPVGVYFGYAAAYDALTLAWMVQNNYDTLQLVIEPQNARAGLKPAYAFEVFQATPTKATSQAGKDRSVFKDLSSTQCKSFYMIDPILDWDNYINYGYISGNKVKDPQIFDPNKMTLSASEYNNFGM